MTPIFTIKRLISVFLAVLFLNISFVSAQITIPAGSYVIDMGVNAATKPNGVRPYGMIHELMKFYNVNVIWAVREGKSKDAIDYSIGGFDYKGGLFIIPKGFITSSVQTAINGWISNTTTTGPNGYKRGLVTARALASPYVMTGAKLDTLTAAPSWTLDDQNGPIAVGFFVNAGIPSTQYNYLAPASLGTCNDLFVMPHADPKWASHGNLYDWNHTYKGGIWLGCHAGSALENMYNPANTSQQCNFLSNKTNSAGIGIILPVNGSTAYSQNSLVLWTNHADPTTPYNTNGNIPGSQTGTSAPADDWVSQFIGVSDAAHTNGSEQGYFPVLGQSWRSSTQIITFDATNNVIPSKSPGTAVIMAYGRGFGDPARGYVMLEAGHDIDKGTAGDMPAQRAFFNWSYLSTHDKQIVIGSLQGLSADSKIYGKDTFSVVATPNFPTPGGLTYTWTATRIDNGNTIGAFSPNGTSSATTTIFDAGNYTSNIDIVITVAVTDQCSRVTRRSYPATLFFNQPPVVPDSSVTTPEETPITVCLPVTDPDGPTIIPSHCGGPRNGTINSWSVSGNSVCITYTPNINFNGKDTVCVVVCDGGIPSKCDTGRVFITVTPVNDPPLIRDTTVNIPQDSTITVCLPVADVDGPTIIPSSCGGPKNGNASSWSVSGSSICVTYTPNSGYFGKDSLCVIVCDGGSPNLCDTAKVYINISCKATAAPSVSLTQPTCLVSTGSINVTAPLSVIYTYSINGVNYQSSTSFSNVVPGSYNVTVKNGTCISPAALAVINPQPPTPSAPAVGTITQPTCLVATGSVVLSGLPSGTWTINPGGILGSGSSTTISGLVAGTYNYTVTNSFGCTSAPSANIVINPQPPTPSAPVVGTITQPTCTVALGSVVLSGLPSGIWTIQPGNIIGSGSSTTISILTPGTYNFTVTNSFGCTSAPSANVVINPQPPTPSAPAVGTITQPTCLLATGSVVLSGLPVGTWTINPGNIIGSGTNTTISGLAAGTYNFTVTNSFGCTSAPSANVVINPQPPTPSAPGVGTITQPTCLAATGSVMLNGLPSGNWVINPGGISGLGSSVTISGLAAGTYNFTVTNSFGCTSAPSASVVINAQPPTPSAPTVGSITHPTCSVATGSVVLNGLPESGTWTINPGNITGTGTSRTITGLAPGTYNFTVTNSFGCTSVPSANVVINPRPTNCGLAPGIFETSTSCSNFTGGTGSRLLNLCYSTRNGKISNVIPGVFFYYTGIVAPSSSFCVDIVQSKSCANYSYFSIQRGTQIILYSASCGTLVNSGVEVAAGQGRICISNATPGATYILSVKYDSKSLNGSGFSGLPPTCTYTFESFVNGIALSNTSASIALVPNCTLATTTTGYKPVSDVPEVSVNAFPNPFRDKVTFKISSTASGKGNLKVYDALGRLVSIVFEGDLKAGSDLRVDYKAGTVSGSLFYIFEQNGKKVRGKLIRQ